MTVNCFYYHICNQKAHNVITVKQLPGRRYYCLSKAISNEWDYK